MSEDDVLFGYRLRVFDHAARTSVSEACRVFGIHRSTYYVWKRRVERHGLEILRPRERRRPRMPQPAVAVCRAADRRVRARPSRLRAEADRERASRRSAGAGSSSSHNGVWRCLRRHGLNTRAKRLSLVAGYAAPYQPPREPAAGAARRGGAAGRAGRDRLLLRRPARRDERSVWQLTAIDVASSFAWAELVSCPQRQPDRRADLEARPPRLRRPRTRPAGSSSACSPTTAASSAPTTSARRSTELGVRHTLIRAGRPQTNGARRSAAPADPRGMLATRLRPLPARPLHRPQTRPRQLHRRLQLRPLHTRPPHPRPHPRRHRLRC